MTTNVPAPAFGPNGFSPPAEAAILAGVLADINAAYGVVLNPGLSTPQGQIASSIASIIGDSNSLFLWFVNNVDPAFSSGRMQDGIARIYFIERISGQPTVVEATCSGLDGVVIPVGALAQAADGNLYVCTQAGTIVGGSVILSFACQSNGPIPCPIGSLNLIYQTIFGWDSITNLQVGALGRLVETRSEFELRRQQSVAGNSSGQLDSVLGKVLAVPNVLDAYCTENDGAAPAVVGGVTLAPKSLYVCALGGDPKAVAFAVWSKKAPGCAYNGNTTVTVSDPNPAYSQPPPSYPVAFEVPDDVSFFVVVTIAGTPAVPSNALASVQGAVISAFAGTDGGSRARIGSTVFASRYYAGIAALGPWAVSIASIWLGTTVGATIVGSISGPTLTVTGVLSGVLGPTQLLQGSGVIPGTYIVEQISGTPNGTGAYRTNQAQTILSEVMSVVPLATEISMNIDQAPTVSPSGIILVLQ